MEQAKILVRLRKEKGLSQTEAARALKVSRQAVSQWENGRAFPSAEKLLALSRLYHVTVEELYDSNVAEEMPVDTGQEMPVDAAPFPETKCNRRKRTIAWGVLAAYICFIVGVLIWGNLTKSLFWATHYIIWGTIFLIMMWLLHFLHQIYKKNMEEQKNEKD